MMIAQVKNGPERTAPPVTDAFLVVGRIGNRAVTALGLGEQYTFDADNVRGAHEISTVDQANGARELVMRAGPESPDQLVVAGSYAEGLLRNFWHNASSNLERNRVFRRWAATESPGREDKSLLYGWVNWHDETVAGGLAAVAYRQGTRHVAERAVSLRGESENTGYLAAGQAIEAVELDEDTAAAAHSLQHLTGMARVALVSFDRQGEVQIDYAG